MRTTDEHGPCHTCERYNFLGGCAFCEEYRVDLLSAFGGRFCPHYRPLQSLRAAEAYVPAGLGVGVGEPLPPRLNSTSQRRIA